MQQNSEDKQNYYDVLGVDKKATQEQIRKAYYALAKKHHPDKGGDPEEFKKIGQAHDTLKDKWLRQQYDASLLKDDIKTKPTGKTYKKPPKTDYQDQTIDYQARQKAMKKLHQFLQQFIAQSKAQLTNTTQLNNKLSELLKHVHNLRQFERPGRVGNQYHSAFAAEQIYQQILNTIKDINQSDSTLSALCHTIIDSKDHLDFGVSKSYKAKKDFLTSLKTELTTKQQKGSLTDGQQHMFNQLKGFNPPKRHAGDPDVEPLYFYKVNETFDSLKNILNQKVANRPKGFLSFGGRSDEVHQYYQNKLKDITTIENITTHPTQSYGI